MEEKCPLLSNEEIKEIINTTDITETPESRIKNLDVRASISRALQNYKKMMNGFRDTEEGGDEFLSKTEIGALLEVADVAETNLSVGGNMEESKFLTEQEKRAKQYVGVKTINAVPMTKGDFEKSYKQNLATLYGRDDAGYLVIYPDGYKSWSPKDVFEEAYKEITADKNHDDILRSFMCGTDKVGKTYGNTDTKGATKNVKDIVFFGDGDTFKLISKASSKNEKWMKSTKFLEIDGVGGVLQVTTQQGDNIAEAVTFVPGVKLGTTFNEDGEVVGRRLTRITGY